MGRPTAVVVGVGAERGLGAALCRRFAAEGYHVLVAGRTPEKIDQVVRTITAKGGGAVPVPTDATQEGDVIRLFDRAMAPGDGLDPADLVVFNAGNNRKVDFRERDRRAIRGFLARRLLRRVPRRSRGRASARAAWPRNRDLHGCVGKPTRQARLRAICGGESRAADGVSEHGARVRAARHSRGACRDRRRHRRRPPLEPAAGSRHSSAGRTVCSASTRSPSTYWQIHRQQRSAWTQEVDLRPYRESF